MPENFAEGEIKVKFHGEKQFQIFGKEYAKCNANFSVKGNIERPEVFAPLTYGVRFKMECNCESVIGNFNKAYEKAFGKTAERIIAKILPPDETPDYTAYLDACLMPKRFSNLQKAVMAKRLPAKVLSAGPQTVLATDLAGQLWLDGFAIGKGVNAVTGNLSGAAITFPALQPATGQSSTTTYSSIKTSSDVEKEVSVAASGSYNMDGMNVTASTSYLSDIKQSELYMTVIATFEVSFNDYDTITYDSPTKIALIPQAKELIDQGNFDTFRNNYGDYFISGAKRRSYFKAIYTLHTSSETDLQNLSASIGANAPEIFTAEGSASFKKAISTNNATVNMVIDMQGYSGTPPVSNWNIDSVTDALTWFKSNLSPIPMHAELQHYSMVDSRIPVTLPIDPEVFSEIGTLYLNTHLMKIAWASLPEEYQSSYQSAVSGLVSEVNAGAQELVTNDTLRTSLFQSVGILLNTLKNLYERVKFIKSVIQLQSAEPGIGANQSGTLSFGSINYPNAKNDPEFVIQLTVIAQGIRSDMFRMIFLYRQTMV